MNRNLWTQTLTKSHCPPWPCPNCNKGTFNLSPDSFVFKETARSANQHGHEAWDPDWITYNFSCWVKCGNTTCGNDAVLTGTGGVWPIWDPEDGGSESWEDRFSPLFCSQMPDMIVLPEKCPKEVIESLRASFALFWSDQAGAAGRLRVAIERLLDHLGVPAKNPDGTEIRLHNRIENFTNGNSEIGGQLMALKWLGNTGSHTGELNKEELMDAYEVLEHALGELIDRRTQKVAELTKRLLQKHDPKQRVSITAPTVPPPGFAAKPAASAPPPAPGP